jgi:hypothetical protein
VDTERIVGFTVLIVVVLSAGGMVFNEILKTVLRSRERTRSDRDRLYEERLARLEAAVDAIAIEVERQGEHVRFDARLDTRLDTRLDAGRSAPEAPEPRLPGRTITPQ